MKVIAYTDGGCSPNPGPGGWGVFMRAFDDEGAEVKSLEIFGSKGQTTNNEMELTAVLEVLRRLTRPVFNLEIISDSKYVIEGASKWRESWKRNNWRLKSQPKKAVANVALWQELDMLAMDHRIKWTWVKGHATTPGNIIADRLATRGCEEAASSWDRIIGDNDPLIEDAA